MGRAISKQAKTFGIFQSTPVSKKVTLQIETAKRRLIWHKFVNIADLNYLTSYHTAFGCEPCPIFERRISHNDLELNLGSRVRKIVNPDSDTAHLVFEQAETADGYPNRTDEAASSQIKGTQTIRTNNVPR